MSSSGKEMSVDIIDLPEDIILKIFSHLSVQDLVLGVRPTCQYFHKLSLMPDLWKHVNIGRSRRGRRPGGSTSYNYNKFFMGMLHQKCIIPTTNEIESIVDDGNNEGQTASNDAQTEARSEPGVCIGIPYAAGSGISLSYHKTEVKSLVTSVEETGDMYDCFSCSLMLFPRVKNMTLVSTSKHSLKFLSHYRELNSLHIEIDATVEYMYSAEIEKGVQCFSVLGNLTMLKTLTFIFPSGQEVSAGVTKYIEDYFLSCPRLTRLHLNILVQDKVISTILDSCCQLEHFELSNVPLTAGAFRSVQRKPNCLLSCLKLTDCPLKDDRCVHAILKGFTNLKNLQLAVSENVSDLGVRALLCGFPQLTVLKLFAVPKGASDVNRPSGQFINDSHSESEDDIDELGGFFYADSLVPKKGKLQVLCLEGFGWLESELYSDLFMNNPKLQKVTLTDCLEVSDDCLQTLSESCLELKSVNIHKCYLVSSVGVSALISQSKYLEKVQCTISDSRGEFVRQLSRLGKESKHQDSRMQVLCLRPWYDVSEKELTVLTTYCPGLLHLVITGGRSLSDDCVEVIMRSCPRLQTIRLEMGPSRQRWRLLTDASLQHVQQWGRNLQQAQWLVEGFFPDTVLAHTLVHSPSLSEFIITAEACENVCIMGSLEKEMRKLQNPKNITVKCMVSLVDSVPVQKEKTLQFCVEKLRPSAHAQNQVKWEK